MKHVSLEAPDSLDAHVAKDVSVERHLTDFFTKETAEKSAFLTMESEVSNSNPLVTGLQYDSKKIKPGNLFFALHGKHTDVSVNADNANSVCANAVHENIVCAINNGAAVIVYDDDRITKNNDIVYIKVKNVRFAMSPISAAFYYFPSKRLLITGVTGKEGKSTTVYLIWQLLTMMGKKAGFISTRHLCLGKEIFSNNEQHTTPEAPVIQRLLYEMADNGCEFAILEASTRGLSIKTNRLGDVEFCSGVLTNLAHEHPEDWEQYRDDKANLFRALNSYIPPANSSFSGPFGVANADDKNSRYFIKLTKHKTFTYSPAGRDGDIILEAIESGAWGNWYMAMIPALKERIEIRDKLPGAINSANVLASILTVSGLLKLPLREITPFVKRLKLLKE